MGKARQFAQNSFWLIVSTVSVVLVGAVYRPIIGRVLGPEEYGRYAFIQIFVTYFLVIAYFGIRSVVTREIGREPTKAYVYLAASAKIRAFTAFIAAVSSCAIGFALQRGGEVTLGICVMSLSIFALAFGELLEGVLVALHKSICVAAANLIGNLLKLVIGVWALGNGYGLIGVLWVFVITSALTAVINWWFVHKTLRCGQYHVTEQGRLRYILKESFPFFVLFIAGKLYAKNDILCLTLIKGDKVTGLYSAAYLFIDLLMSIGNCFTQAAYPIIARIYGESLDEQDAKGLVRAYERLHKHMLMLFLPISVLLTVFGLEILLLIFGRDYLGGYSAMIILVWIPPIEVSCLISGNFLAGTYRQRLEAKIATVISTLSVVWTIYFVYMFGAIGAAIATVGSSSVNAVVRYVYLKRSIGPASLANSWIKPIVCTGAMFLVLQLLSEVFLVWRLLAGILVFVAATAVVKPYDKEDKRMLLTVLKRQPGMEKRSARYGCD